MCRRVYWPSWRQLGRESNILDSLTLPSPLGLIISLALVTHFPGGPPKLKSLWYYQASPSQDLALGLPHPTVPQFTFSFPSLCVICQMVEASLPFTYPSPPVGRNDANKMKSETQGVGVCPRPASQGGSGPCSISWCRRPQPPLPSLRGQSSPEAAPAPGGRELQCPGIPT